MGLAIVPEYDIESEVAANAVVVTRVLNTDDVFGYSCRSRRATTWSPTPTRDLSEVTIAGFISDDEPTSFTVTRFAKPTPRRRRAPRRCCRRADARAGRPRQAGENAYCRARPGYYPGECDFVTATTRRSLARPRVQDPRERAFGLQAGARVRRQLSLAVA